MAENKIQLVVEALDKTKAAFLSLNNNFQALKTDADRAGQGITSVFNVIASRGMAVTATIVAIGAGITKIVTDTARTGEELLKYSQQIGMSVEALSKIKKVSEVAETSFEDVITAVGKFSKELHSAAADDSFARAIKAIGLNINELKSVKPEDALLAISEKFDRMQDGTAKTALAMEMFGRSGKSMIPLLNQLKDNFDKFNSSFNREHAEAADKFNDSLAVMKMRFQSLKNTIGSELIPVLNEFLALLTGDVTEKQIQKLDEKIGYWFNELARVKDFKKSGKPDPFGLLPSEDEINKKLKELIEKRNKMQSQLSGENKKRTDEKDFAPELPAKTKEGLSDADKRLLKQHEAKLKEGEEATKALDEREKREREYALWKMKLYEDIDALAEKIAEKEKARREGQIQADLAQIDIAEKERIMSKTDATKERIRLNKENLQVQEESLEIIGKLNDPAGWYAQQNAITETRKRLLELNAALKEQVGTLNGGLAEGFRRYIYQLDTSFQQGVKLAQQTAQAMEQAFSDFFFDAFQGKLKSLGDYLTSFFTSVQRAMAQALGQQVSGSIIKGIGSIFSSGGGITAEQYNSAGPAGQIWAHSGGYIMHTGGYIPKFHWGGLSSDEVPAILQRGEYVVSRRGVAALDAINQGRVSGGGDTGKQEVHNYYYINAVDAKSFADMVERNPGAITKILHEDQRRGGSLWR